MNTSIVTVGTVTYAIKARKLLSRNGIQSKLVKLDSQKTKSGCVYGLEINNYEFLSAATILRENGLYYLN